MTDKIDILESIFKKINKLHFLLFLFLAVYIGLKWSSLNIANNDINQLRKGKIELVEIIDNLKSLHSDYLQICKTSKIEKEKIIKLNSFFKYVNNKNELTNKTELSNTIHFLQFILSNIDNLKADINDVKLKDFINISNNIRFYNNYINNLELSEEVVRHIGNYDFFTPEQKSKIFGGENIFVAITDNFGIRLQQTNELEEGNFEKEINEQAKKLYYSSMKFNKITFAQINNLKNSYENYINTLLENRMTNKNSIPIIDFAIDNYSFSKVLLFFINLFIFLLLVELIRFKDSITDKIRVFNYSYITYIFHLKTHKHKAIDKYTLILWSILNIFIVPIAVIIFYLTQANKSLFETLLIISFAILYFIWINFTDKLNNK